MINLNLAWTQPTPIPTCGYRILYKRMADTDFNIVAVSGSTATISVDAPACYEGYVQGNCCGDSLSLVDTSAFGVNTWQKLTLTVATVGSNWVVSGTTDYANPYDALVSGTIYYHIGASHYTLSGSGTLPAGSTSASLLITAIPSGAIFDSVVITNISPIFNNGGELQQADPISSPLFFDFSSGTSAPVWNGSPTSLPSFLLTRFVVTELDVDLVTVLAGRLDISYILSEYYSTSFTTITVEVYDSTTLIGTTTIPVSPLGLVSASINLEKGPNTLSTSTQFTMKVLWPDTTLINSKTFYLPTF